MERRALARPGVVPSTAPATHVDCRCFSSAVTARVDAINQVGLYDPALLLDDYDLYLRLALEWKIVFLEGAPVARYRLHAQQMTTFELTTGQIQTSPQTRAVSQFEDTRVFGPANSFFFTIHESTSFMGAPPEPLPGGSTIPGPVGEWHLHCHVLGHMMGGMMGSLLIVQGGEIAGALPRGSLTPPPPPPPTGVIHDVSITGSAFVPAAITAAMGDTVRWTNQDPFAHTVSADDLSFNSGDVGPNLAFSRVMSIMGDINYHCNIHTEMKGTIHVTM